VFTASYVRLFVDEERQQRLREELYELVAVQFGERPVLVPYDIDLFVGERTEVS
jgi:hypothetical protein